MNPDFLKYLQQITSSLRSGLTANPFDELQKRATQIGEDTGTQLEQMHAQAGYAKTHPESQRAQQERMTNAAMFALQMGRGGEKPSLTSAIRTPEGIKTGYTHFDAFMKHGIDPATIKPKDEGFVDAAGKWFSRQQAEKLMDRFMSAPIKAQIATRAEQAGRDVGVTSEDLKGKLYANRGTKADEPMTLDDMNRIMAKKKGAAMDSVVSNVFQQVAPKDFHAAVQSFAGAHPDEAGFLTPHSPEEMSKEGTRTYLSPDKKTGYAIHPSGDIQNVFNYGEKGNGANAVKDALKNGGNKLDAFDTKLGDFYRNLGFKETSRTPWDAQYKPAGWNSEKYGTPDVITMRHPGAGNMEWHDTMEKWRSAFSGFQSLTPELHDIAAERGKALAEAYRNPDRQTTPWLSKYMQQDIARPNGVSPQKLSDVEGLAHDTFTSPRFKNWLAAGRGTGGWYDTRASMGRAIDALGEKLGPQAFNEFIDHVAASTAMSRPENNIRRASWWRALNLSGQLDPQELRTSTLAAPTGMGHIAQRAHHFAMADLAEAGKLNVLANPKPGAFAENLKMNWKPYTNDTRMATATLQAEPKMSIGLAGTPNDATPRKWAYSPIEKAAQSAAAEAHAAGLIDEPPKGVDPTAAWQAQVWGGIGREGNRGIGLKPSQFNGNFNDILDKLISRSAKLWGVNQTTANKLFWEGHPLDLPLDAELTTGKPRKR